MAKINILESSVYNRIAAGEVVERPASVVKEFVENSIDAGAKNISVWIERGGKDLIRVADDGEGIEAGELRSAFLPHATSKIARAEDLERIETLGVPRRGACEHRVRRERAPALPFSGRADCL